MLAARVSKVNFKVSIKDNTLLKSFLESAKALFTENDSIAEESNTIFAQTLGAYERVIYSDINKVLELVFKEIANSLTFIIRQKPMMEGRL